MGQDLQLAAEGFDVGDEGAQMQIRAALYFGHVRLRHPEKLRRGHAAEAIEADRRPERGARFELLELLDDVVEAEVVRNPAVYEVQVRPPGPVVQEPQRPVVLRDAGARPAAVARRC